MNLFKVSCSEVKVHFDMFLTHHVQFHRRLSDHDQKKTSSQQLYNNHQDQQQQSNVTMDDHNQNQNQHQLDVHQNAQQADIAVHNNAAQDIDYEAIDQVAEQMKTFADQFYREHTTNRFLQKVNDNASTILICSMAALVVYQCARK